MEKPRALEKYHKFFRAVKKNNGRIGKNLRVLELVYSNACNFAILYGKVMNTKDKSLPYENRDKFILSKGHGVLGLYTALSEFGILPKEELNTFQQDGSRLVAHPVMDLSIGIESSSGSLGQGVSMAVGLALAAKKKNYSYNTYVIVGNGECNEGFVWEAMMSAKNFRLDNLTVVIDNNGLQSDSGSGEIMDVSTRYADMLKALNMDVREIDGHNFEELLDTFSKGSEAGKTRVIVAKTVKGKGVSFMENNNEWHHNRLTQAQYEEAVKELEAESGN